MIGRLRAIRLSWPQVAMVAAASALATALIIATASGGSPGPWATLAALRHGVTVHSVQSPTSAEGSGTSATAAAPTSPGAPAATPSLTAPTLTDPASAAASSAATSGSEASSGAGSGGGDSGGDGSGSATTTAQSTSSGDPSAHVFVIALTTPSYRAAFGPGSVARYLNHTLRRRGALLSGYQTLGGSELPDYLAMVSGQAPNADTRRDCTTYAEFSSSKALASGQVPGGGCVYPNTVLTIADQVTAAGKQWGAYLADMGSSTCVHPNSGAADDGPLPFAGTEYATRHNPFIYFHSLLDLGSCSSDDVSLPELTKALHSARRTPNYVFIAPGLCDEPGAGSCPTGEASGLAGEDSFLKRWVPAITASAAYRQHGSLLIVFAKAPGSNGSRPVRTGALILSAKAKADSTVAGAYNPYSVLRSVEDVFGYTPLVHAKSARSFAQYGLAGA